MGRKKAEMPDPEIERAFLDALARLDAGKPTDPGLKRRSEKGRLRINFSTVAKEAGRARGLVAVEETLYSTARDAILDKMAPVSKEQSPEVVIAQLRKRIQDLEKRLENADSVNAVLMLRVEDERKQAERAKANVDRLRKSRDSLIQDQNQKIIQFPKR